MLFLTLLKFKKVLVTTLVVVTVFTVLAPDAQADFLGIGDIANSTIAKIILFVQSIIIGFIGKTLAMVAGLFGTFLKFQGNYLTDITIVRTSWEIFRDFANMFFILILVIIAFATIFDSQRYNWKGLMSKFLIAALLINFSLVISQYVISVATTLSNIMLNQFSDITGNLAAGLGVNFWLDPARTVSATSDAEKLLVNTVISSIGIIIVGAIALLSMLSAAIFSIVRIPILWALMIISPIAWIAGVLPNTRRFFDWWKKVFIGWTFFLPIYLFALMMGVAILAGRPDLEVAAKMSVNQTVLTRTGNLFGFAFQELFYYVLTVIIMVWGLILALKASFLADTGVNKTFGFIQDRVKRYSRVTALEKAAKAKFAEKMDTGVAIKGKTIFGGERAERLREAKMAERFGIKGVLSAAQAAEVRKEYDRYKGQNLNKDELDKIHNTPLTNWQKLAVRQLRADNGWIPRGADGKKEVQDTVRILGENTKVAQDYIASLVRHDFKDMAGSPLEMQDFVLDSETPNELKKAALKVMAKKGDLGELQNERLFRLARTLAALGSDAERDEMDSALIKNFDRLDERVVDALIASGEMNDDQVLDLDERRVEKGWVPTGGAGRSEIEGVIASFGGERSQRSQKYINTLVKFDFMNKLGSQAEKEDFVSTTSITALKNAGLEVMAKNNDLITNDLVKMGLDSLAGQTKEKRDRIYENLKKNIKNAQKDKKTREAFLLGTASADMRKLQAEQMLDDGELDTYDKYAVAENLFGGESETLSRNARDKLDKEQAIIHTETLWRKERKTTTGDTRFTSDPTWFGGATDQAVLKTKMDERFKKMNAKSVADLNNDSWTKIPGFEETLIKKLKDEQDAKKPIPAVGGRKPIPGGGELFLQNLQRLTSGNKDKGALLNKLNTDPAFTVLWK